MISHKGVLSKNYHIQREKKHAAKYRLKRRSNEVLKAIKRYTKEHQLSLLDIGAADGLMLKNFENQLYLKPSIGIDYSSELLKFANSNKSFFIQSDATSLPFKDYFFDVVIACAIIEHVPDAGAMINECHRVLKPGGLIIITTPDPFFEQIATKVGHLKEDDHNETFNLKKLDILFQFYGFDILEAEKFMMHQLH